MANTRCEACRRSGLRVERIVRSDTELYVCVNAVDCRANWPSDAGGSEVAVATARGIVQGARLSAQLSREAA